MSLRPSCNSFRHSASRTSSGRPWISGGSAKRVHPCNCLRHKGSRYTPYVLNRGCAASSAANSAQQTADAAMKEAAAARAAAERAEKAAMDAKAASEATEAKIDNMFKKSMQKG